MKLVNTFARIFSTFFWVGYSPVVPGTIGSFIGAVLWYVLPYKAVRVRLPVIILLFIVGVVTATIEEKTANKKDPKNVVIDEVVGVWILFILTGCLYFRQSILKAVLAFVLFRFFDVMKVPPMKKIENFNGGLGIMLDDAVAAIYAAVVVNIIFLLL